MDIGSVFYVVIKNFAKIQLLLVFSIRITEKFR
jgi:hypothetical protein